MRTGPGGKGPDFIQSLRTLSLLSYKVKWAVDSNIATQDPHFELQGDLKRKGNQKPELEVKLTSRTENQNQVCQGSYQNQKLEESKLESQQGNIKRVRSKNFCLLLDKEIVYWSRWDLLPVASGGLAVLVASLNPAGTSMLLWACSWWCLFREWIALIFWLGLTGSRVMIWPHYSQESTKTSKSTLHPAQNAKWSDPGSIIAPL